MVQPVKLQSTSTDRKDLVGILEAAYRLDGDEGTWLARVVDRAARAGLDRGLGACGMFYDLTSGVRVWNTIARGTPDGAVDALRALEGAATPADAKRFLVEGATCSTMSARLGMGAKIAAHPAHRAFLAPLGIADFLGVGATEPSGSGCLIGAPIHEVTSVRRDDARSWTRVAAHVAAGLRLRRGRRAMEAVLTPSGKVEHAEDAAKDSLAALGEGARAVGHAMSSTPLGDGSSRAIESWRALTGGRWSLVDQFDHDGKRYIVAYKNSPESPGAALPSLTEREGQVLGYLAQGHSNKLIGYELGLAPSTVAMHLGTAAGKLGTTTRVALVKAAKRMMNGGR
ncbi:hypothetical protein BH09MYX1_BH09MYX1_60140 [soil metagenome]